MNTLKPCPFCGGTKICTEKGINLNYCDKCSAESNVEHWNTRPIEDELRAEIERLKVRIEELEAAGTILRDCFSLHKPNWLIDKDAIKEWDELTKKECE